jgi:hypothetical protein
MEIEVTKLQLILAIEQQRQAICDTEFRISQNTEAQKRNIVNSLFLLLYYQKTAKAEMESSLRESESESVVFHFQFDH